MKRRCLTIGAVLVAAPAAAQDPIMALNPTTMVGYSGTIAADQYAKRAFGQHVRERHATSASAASINPARFAYHPSAAVRQRVYARAVAAAQKDMPGDAGKLRQLFQSGIVTRDTSRYLARYGMSATNVADTAALYLALAWQISNGTPDDPSRAQMIGLRNQVAATFASMPSFAHASDATKQELSESNIIWAAYAANVGNRLDKDRSVLPQARTMMVKGVMQLYGFDLRKVTLTASGFR